MGAKSDSLALPPLQRRLQRSQRWSFQPHKSTLFASTLTPGFSIALQPECDFFSSLSQKGGVKNYHREQRAISEALLGSKGRNASHDSQEALMHNLMFITAPKGRRLQRELGEGERNLQTY